MEAALLRERISTRCPGSGSRLCRGLHSAVLNLCWPLGGWWLSGFDQLCDPRRRSHGLAIVLPGVEGRSPLNWSIAQGLNDAGFPGSIEVVDWTTGFWPLFPYHLRAGRRNRARAQAIAATIVDYQREFPGRPTCIVGHSGGAALTAWVLEALPPDCRVTTAAMLGPALPRRYQLHSALMHVEQTLWNFWTPLDVLFLAAGTILCGNLNGRHALAAGCASFAVPQNPSDNAAQLYDARLRQYRFRLADLPRFHLGGHMSWANRTFIAEVVAPRLFS